jgi:HNH endonuclease
MRETRRLVRDRAGGRCEYCGLPESAFDFSFHIEHIRAKQHHGNDEPDNLCLACDRCNLYKGPNLSAVDSESDAIVPLFHPRRDVWSEHFAMIGCEIAGLTPTGRATVGLLQMNDATRIRTRLQLERELEGETE